MDLLLMCWSELISQSGLICQLLSSWRQVLCSIYSIFPVALIIMSFSLEVISVCWIITKAKTLFMREKYYKSIIWVNSTKVMSIVHKESGSCGYKWREKVYSGVLGYANQIHNQATPKHPIAFWTSGLTGDGNPLDEEWSGKWMSGGSSQVIHGRLNI